MMKKKKLWITVFIVGFLIIAGYRLFLSPRWELPILMYHYIDNKEGSLYVTVSNFKRQMAYLKKRGFHVIPLAQLIDGKKQGRVFDRNTVVITFDDGQRDNYTQAFPILKKYGFPATFFVETGFIGTQDFFTADQIQEMAKAGMDFGAHTQNNKYLPSLSPERINYEMSASKKDLERILGRPIQFFSYPFGGFNDQAKQAVQKYGYQAAVTTNRGASVAHSDLYAIKRVKIGNADAVKPFHMWGKLTGYYNAFRRFRPGS